MARPTSRSRVRQWAHGWPLHMPICSWTGLKELSLPRNLSSLLSGNATLTISCTSELDNFLDRLNRAHHSITFTWSISNKRIQFLDLNIFKGDRFNETGHLDLSTHFKSTNTFQCLHFSSSHPRSVFKGLVKGEAIRFLCSNTHAPTYHATLRKFRQHLLLRNYPPDFVDRILGSITSDLRASYIPSLSLALPYVD